MSVSKKLQIQGISIISFDDAIKNALEETAMTIEHIVKLDVIKLSDNSSEASNTIFIRNISSNLQIDMNNDKILEDDEWIDEVSFTMPYIIKALNKPNKNPIIAPKFTSAFNSFFIILNIKLSNSFMSI